VGLSGGEINYSPPFHLNKTWVLETWVTDLSASKEKQKIGTQKFMEPVDAIWIQIMSYYAQRHNMKVVTPFYEFFKIFHYETH
jgi:hypothetical protein